jgi:hypothetical protein
MIPTLGATISGFSAYVLACGPRLEKLAIVSSLSTAPTVSAVPMRRWTSAGITRT